MSTAMAEGRQLLADDSDDDFALSDFSDKADPKETLDAVHVADFDGLSIFSKTVLSTGLALMAITFGLDAATTGSYSSYALSSFKQLSQQGLLDVLDSTIAAALKLPIAKISDVLGRAETYCILMVLYAAGHAVRAIAPSYAFYVLGDVLYGMGQAGTAMLNMILISDFTSMRTRGMATNAFYLSITITPWASGLIVDSVIEGIGWRWGYGMFALIMPVGASVLIAVLLYLQRQVARFDSKGITKITARQFCSQIDLGGLILLCGGLAALLLPMLLVSQSQNGSASLGLILIMILGGSLFLGAWPYEKYIARNPAVPVKYFRSRLIVCALLISCFDAIGFRATHTYLFPWSIAARNFSASQALYLSYTNGIAQVITGILIGIVMYRRRSYKWIALAGSLIRLLGYGVMMRLRTNDSSTFELFLVQVIQGIGSGILETTSFVAAQISAPENELAQITAVIAECLHLGGGVGAAIAGWIYTGHLKEYLRFRLGSGVGEDEIDNLYDSITGTLPDWGSAQRDAVGAAYSDVLGSITLVAVAVSLPVVIFAVLLPDKKLEDGKTLTSRRRFEEEVELERHD